MTRRRRRGGVTPIIVLPVPPLLAANENDTLRREVDALYAAHPRLRVQPAGTWNRDEVLYRFGHETGEAQMIADARALCRWVREFYGPAGNRPTRLTDYELKHLGETVAGRYMARQAAVLGALLERVPLTAWDGTGARCMMAFSARFQLEELGGAIEAARRERAISASAGESVETPTRPRGPDTGGVCPLSGADTLLGER